jgi:hypothetical protein
VGRFRWCLVAVLSGLLAVALSNGSRAHAATPCGNGFVAYCETLTDQGFEDSSLIVPDGAQIIFINDGSVFYDVSSDDGYDSGPIPPHGGSAPPYSPTADTTHQIKAAPVGGPDEFSMTITTSGPSPTPSPSSSGVPAPFGSPSTTPASNPPASATPPAGRPGPRHSPAAVASPSGSSSPGQHSPSASPTVVAAPPTPNSSLTAAGNLPVSPGGGPAGPASLVNGPAGRSAAAVTTAPDLGSAAAIAALLLLGLVAGELRVLFAEPVG